jgi:basic amino acid/polyamine antiporter, APA family
VVATVLVLGIRESARFNGVMVAIKLGVVAFVIGVGVFYVNPANWHPFAPYGYSGLSFFGKTVLGQEGAGGEPLGMLAGAAMIFFAYIGFDALSTQAEEARNPSRDLPIGIIVSLTICTVLYIAVAAVLTGMIPYQKLNIKAPISDAFGQVGLAQAEFWITIGALTGMTSVLLVMMLSQPRVLLAMARDGLLPPGFFAAIHPRFQTPWKSTILTGVVVATMGSLLPLRVLAELVNIGTLLAFVIVCAAVLVMRYTNPNAPRPFRAPLGWLTPVLGILFCLMLMFSLPWENWVRLAVWLAIGLTIYFLYSRHHSRLARNLRGEISVHGVSPAGMPGE